MTFFERAARAHIDSRGSAGTRELYTADLDRWLKHCAAGDIDVSDPTERAAIKFRDDLVASLSAQTVRRVLSALSKMYKVAVAKRVATWNPFDVDALSRPPADEVSVTAEFMREQVDALFAAVAEEGGEIGARDLAVMRLLYDTGMRVTSVTSLRREQIRERADGARALLVKVKKKGRVEVELPASSVKALESWLAVAPKSPWVFPAGRGDGPLTRRAMSQRLTTYGERAGVKDAAPHRFRATYITEAFDAGLSLSEIQASVHHSDPNSTQRYDRGSRGAGVASAVAKFREKRK